MRAPPPAALWLLIALTAELPLLLMESVSRDRSAYAALDVHSKGTDTPFPNAVSVTIPEVGGTGAGDGEEDSG